MNTHGGLEYPPLTDEERLTVKGLLNQQLPLKALGICEQGGFLEQLFSKVEWLRYMIKALMNGAEHDKPSSEVIREVLSWVDRSSSLSEPAKGEIAVLIGPDFVRQLESLPELKRVYADGRSPAWNRSCRSETLSSLQYSAASDLANDVGIPISQTTNGPFVSLLELLIKAAGGKGDAVTIARKHIKRTADES
ncbi:hypothetical protein MIB92_11880 [Aestuariirhabdus sp. Z084]|uniref:hypothetical protein n=1 Tax=Aestuariirhabdus haliotis TaxID=2918751 RepID=UPI00201B4528|nr:hypothetical protein [Aestuariirhabdus haliotis]MCL6416351.1 hypothetical protein [Aestuariirhabdus haliotis]MCL6420340.1 hypothetical protein [Aestuariirhabdus haliotis]